MRADELIAIRVRLLRRVPVAILIACAAVVQLRVLRPFELLEKRAQARAQNTLVRRYWVQPPVEQHLARCVSVDVMRMRGVVRVVLCVVVDERMHAIVVVDVMVDVSGGDGRRGSGGSHGVGGRGGGGD